MFKSMLIHRNLNRFLFYLSSANALKCFYQRNPNIDWIFNCKKPGLIRLHDPKREINICNI